MLGRRTSSLFQVLLTPIALGCLTGAQPATRDSHESVAAQVHQILGVGSAGGNYLPRLAALIGAPASERAGITGLIDGLVDGLLEGNDPDEFSRLLTSGVNITDIDGIYRQPGWTYGSPLDRIALVNLVWAQALSGKASENRSAEYAKAAMLLAAHEDFLNGDAMLRRIYRDPKLFAKVAQLTAEQDQRLQTLLSALFAVNEEDGRASADVIYAEAELIRSKDQPLPAKTVQREIDALQHEWEVLAKSPGLSLGNRFEVIHSAWNLRNLAHARSDIEAQKRVDDLLAAWRAEHWPNPIDRWLDQALSSFGPPPTRPRIIGPGAPKE